LIGLARVARSYHEPEPGAPKYPASVVPYYSTDDQRPDLIEKFTEYRSRVMYEHQQKGLVYVECNGLKFYAHIIAQLMPNAKFFFVHRHPAEFVRSGIRRGWYKDHHWDSTRLTPREQDPAARHWNGWDQFEKICWLWHTTNAFFLEFLTTIKPERYVVLPFADIVAINTNAWTALFDLAAIPRPSVSQVDSVLNVKHNAQQTGAAFEVEDLSPEHWDKMQSIAGETMARLGYVCGDPKQS